MQQSVILSDSYLAAKSHYENFPVASILLPKHLRQVVAVIYHFARQADDFADEGNLTVDERLSLLNGFDDELKLIEAYIQPSTAFFKTLLELIKQHHLPLTPFFDLLDAFKQDVVKTRYENFDEILAYCQRSANPVGLLLLHLYQANSPQNIEFSNNVCTALQLINFLQDIAIDFEKNAGKQRIYLCQDELLKFGISESHIQAFVQGRPIDNYWSEFMRFNLLRAQRIMNAGKPLVRHLKGRIGLEMRMIIAGGERIIAKIAVVNGDVFRKRPTLNKWDWCVIFCKALLL
jgi:squalene synthase HpnC